MDSSTRNFLALVVVAVVVYAILGLAACAVVSVAAERLVDGGFGALMLPGGDLRPALAIGLTMAAVAGSGIWSLHRQLVATERLARRVRSRRGHAPAGLRRAASAVGLSGRVQTMDAPEVFSFTYGFIRPRVVVSTGMVAVTDHDELRAVLEHERYHVRQLDPLKSLVARALPDAFFFLPVLRDLRDRYLTGRELAADRRVVDRFGRATLASALYKSLGAPLPRQAVAGAAVGGFDLLPARLSQMEAGCEPPPPPLSPRALAISIGAATALALALGAASGALPGGIIDVHQQMTVGEGSPTATVGAALCGAFWAWRIWRVVRWVVAARSPIAVTPGQMG